MPSRYTRSLFLFRRDLRLYENLALQAACSASRSIVPAFVFDPRQTDPDANAYFSPNAFEVLTHALEDLAADSHLSSLPAPPSPSPAAHSIHKLHA